MNSTVNEAIRRMFELLDQACDEAAINLPSGSPETQVIAVFDDLIDRAKRLQREGLRSPTASAGAAS